MVSLLAPTLQAFFTQRLATQRQASGQTVAAYRDALRLLLEFVARQAQTAPSKLDLADLDAPMIAAFLDHLERTRGNSARTRNARLAAIHSLFRFAALRHPEHAGSIQRVLAIPQKRFDRALVSFLTRQEAEALLASPDRSTWIGRRDHTLLLVAVQTGLRVAELIALRCADVQLGTGPHLRCHGKSRKQRCTPLTTQTAATLRAWRTERQGNPADPLFPSRRGGPLSPDAVQSLVAKHANRAAQRCPSLGPKNVTPHVLRHTCAMALREAGVDISTIALWLGHESIATTQIYLHADLALKERALARTAPPAAATPGRYRPPDPLLAFLEGL
jgi:site-specific recombinase XerD